MRLLVATALLLAGPVASPGPNPPETAVLEALQDARRELGSPGLRREPALDAVAGERARLIAALPEDRRLTLDLPIDTQLIDAGITQFVTARAHVGLEKGSQDLGRAFLDRWQGYRESWKRSTSDAWDTVGIATHPAEDGWLVLVAVLVDEAQAPSTVELEDLERRIFRAVNHERRKRGISRLEYDSQLAQVAGEHSGDMARRAYLGHVTPDGLGPGDRARRSGIGFDRLGENLHYSRGYHDPVPQAIESWLDSPGHRRTMLDEGFDRTGVGVVVGDDGGVHITQLFLSR